MVARGIGRADKPIGSWQVRIIELDASGWATVLDFMGALRRAIGAPVGHGWSPAAFVDSMIWGGMNSVEPPYMIRIVRTADLDTEVRDYITMMAGLLLEARADHYARRGIDVEVSISVPEVSN